MMRIELLIKTGGSQALVDLVKHSTNKYLPSNIDLTYVFLKATSKKLS